MNIQVLATKTDFCLANLAREFEHLELAHQVNFIEDIPDSIRRNDIRHSPSIFINGELVFRCQPTEQQLRQYIATHPC